jgi:hypothetical protein
LPVACLKRDVHQEKKIKVVVNFLIALF